MKRSPATHRYFFELLLEEIPAWMLASRLSSLRHDLLRMIESSFGFTPENAPVVEATSRRIFFHLTGLPAKQADREEELKGPPRRLAFDASGSPSKALLGFLGKNDATLNDIVEETDDYIRLRRTVAGRTAVDVLTEQIPAIIEAIHWPKMMRWGSAGHSFIRPVHSVISIFDSEPMPIEIFGVRSGTTTVGHRTLGNRVIPVSSHDDYVEKLAAAHVVVGASRRVEIMRKRALELAREVGGLPAEDESIWEQWRYLTEAAGLVRAEFDPEYLKLPDEVLVTVMRVHQKQLPILFDRSLSNSFLAVIDQTGDPDGNAASGNSFVTNARFADARFFYETDRRRPLEDRLPELAHLQFHEKLGSYAEKAQRIEANAAAISRALGIDPADAALAARLSKADLVTEMVKELTELQGKIGGIYAREEGKGESVWTAIYDHYLPVNADDPLPRGIAGAVVSLADRIDTLTGFFQIGLRPTGSKDPLALRRAAQGVVQILLNRSGWRVDISLEQLIDIGLDSHGRSREDARSSRAELLEFFGERARTLLENPPYDLAYDEIAAAMAAGWANSLTDLHDRAAALRSIRNQPRFLSILDSAKRIANITADAPGASVDRSLLVEPAEERLFTLVEAVGEQIDELIAEKKYRDALESFAGLAGELEEYFVKVFVMVEDDALRNNRKALLRRAGNLVAPIAEVTRIVVDRKELAGKN